MLAESWEVSEDGLTWTFHLRSGVKFHDGVDLTSEAVKGSIERTVKIGGGAAFIWSSVASMETPDPLTFVMKLSAPQPMDMTASAGFAAWILSPGAFDKDNAWFNAGNGAGTGPYMVERFEPGQRAILTRNPNYWGTFAEGAFDKAVFEIVEDAVLAQSLIESGEADWTYTRSERPVKPACPMSQGVRSRAATTLW